MAASESTKIATKLWVQIIQYELGGISLGLVEKKLYRFSDISNTEFWKSCSRRFHHFKAGTKTPGPKYIEYVNNKIPGTASIFGLQLWWILENPQASLRDIRSHMQNLEPLVYNRLFRKPKSSGPSPRRILRNLNQIRNIGRINTLDALAGLLMLQREIEITEQYDYYGECKYEIRDLLSRLAAFSPYSEIAESLDSLITERFIAIKNPLPDECRKGNNSDLCICYLSPDTYWDVHLEALENVLILWKARYQRHISRKPEALLDHLFFEQLKSSRRYQPPDPQQDLFPIRLCSCASRPCRSKQYIRSVPNRTPVQLDQNTHLRALDGFAHCAGHF